MCTYVRLGVKGDHVCHVSKIALKTAGKEKLSSG